MRIRLSALVLAIAVAAFGGLVIAASANPNHGKTLFRAGCKTCHIKDGGAKDLTPLSKTQAQWTRAFKAPALTTMVKRVETKTGKALTDADVTDIQAFLVAHAIDSDQPETCGAK
jgi:cytochrome c553